MTATAPLTKIHAGFYVTAHGVEILKVESDTYGTSWMVTLPDETHPVDAYATLADARFDYADFDPQA